MPPSDELLAEHHALIPSDNAFQRSARLHQALWRERHGLPIGDHRGGPLGSRLAMPDAKDKLLNFLNDAIRNVVLREVLEPTRRADKLYGEPRIFNDLLSSQPMVFNLFGELRLGLALAGRVFSALTNGRVQRVTAIEFEHSPGRGDPRYTGDRSAFDVYVEYISEAGKRGFIGIEVKYHEGLGDTPAPHRERYDEIADAMGVFKADARERLKGKPLQQIWRDHLLAGSLLHDRAAGFDDGLFAFVYPDGNHRCAKAVTLYWDCLTDSSTFVAWTLEDVVAAAKTAGAGSWVEAFEDRYLGFEKLRRWERERHRRAR